MNLESLKSENLLLLLSSVVLEITNRPIHKLLNLLEL
jgi:hypothetical protein